MPNARILLSACIAVFLFVSCATSDSSTNADPVNSIESWVTTADKKSLFAKSSTFSFSDSVLSSNPVIDIDTGQQFQSIDGFGYALTGGSADLINTKLTELQRNKLLRELFSPEGDGIGVSYLRISIGASDLDDHVFTYADLPEGQIDPALKSFSLKEDQENLIPVLKRILAINPDIRIMGSPWTAPVWMKSNGKAKGGSLRPEYYGTYAQYFVKYIERMAAEGISIDAITIQNEPENPNNTPSLVMTAEEQRDFIRFHLGPAFEKAGIQTRIVVFDHNCDHPQYPITILNDPEAKQYVDGSAFHLYLGDISALSTVHDAHPDKNIYFTEQWTWSKGEFGGDLRLHVKNLIIGATRNWSRTVIEWNLASDPNFDPHTDDGGCAECMGALIIGDSITRNVSYYIIAHASKFVRPGSIRIGSNVTEDFPNVAFKIPGGRIALIVLNDAREEKAFGIRYNGMLSRAITLPPGAVGTYVWDQ